MFSASSFDDLIRKASENSVKGSFGANLKRPEDALREKKRKEAADKRAERYTVS